MAELIGVCTRAGTTVLLVEQNVRLGLGLAEHGVVMEGGRVLLSSTAHDLLDNPEMADLFFGGYTGDRLRRVADGPDGAERG